MSNADEIAAALQPVVDAFEHLGVTYYIGGSVASSAYGVARATLDVDVVSSLKIEHVAYLLTALKDSYYVSQEHMVDAIRRTSSFNVIHLETALKIDVFITKNRGYDRASEVRIRRDTLADDKGAPQFYLAAPEDVVLAKIEWFKSGGESSDRQWNDILGVLKVQGRNIDTEYLKRWAEQLGVGEILDRALLQSQE